MNRIANFARWSAALWLVPAGVALAADPFPISSVPLFLAPAVKPNVMVVFDNSQSMDATMSGMIISGNLANTRSNIARGVLKSVLQTNLDSFNWGLATFETTNTNTLYNTQAYYLGNQDTMVYTNDCDVSGVSATNAGRRCVPNPEPAANGFNFITYDRSGDDADINDVFYTPNNGAQQYGIGQSGTTYQLWPNRQNPSGSGWEGNFSGGSQNITFVPTDAGFLLQAATHPRAFFVSRGWGWAGNFSINNGLNITGRARILEPVKGDFQPGFDASAHLGNLNGWLASETASNSPEIKNSALFTPLAGSLRTVRDYFAQGESPSRKSPITETCQQNYVVLATDGNPTGKLDGTQYNPSQWVNTPNGAGGWNWGQAQQDVFAEINSLKTITLSGGNLSKPSLAGEPFRVKTYIIGMGDTVANASSVAALHEMARLGEGNDTAFLGNSVATLTNAFESIVANIENKTASAAAAAVNASSWNTDSRVYLARFQSGEWSGNLLAFDISAAGVLAATPSWQAATQIAAQNWNTQRNIITYKPSGAKGIPFRWPANPASPTSNELDVAQSDEIAKDASGTTDAFGAQRLAFLRGDVSREPRNCGGCAAPQFRDRTAGPLGDIVSSAPYYVAAPPFGYANDFESASYGAFAATYKNRTPVLYVGANDGMLHAINANTGVELFAYVPSVLVPALGKLSSPSYNHRFYVDGTPTVGDVFYGGAWHTLLVAGMRSGAKGVFALDVTNPANFSEGNAASIVRWEFQDDDLGHVYGQPLLVKTNNGKWSVIVAGGYNAGGAPATGRAMLFVIDAATGGLDYKIKIDTGAGSLASPNGLSAPAAIDTNGDGIVDVVYAGDLDGNLWKFDLGSATPASWALGNGGAALFATGGQPITGAPDVTRMPKNRAGYMIGFGTGRYIANADNTNTSSQAIYAVWDNLQNGTVTLAQLQQQAIIDTATRLGVQFRLSTHAIGIPADTLLTGNDNGPTTLASYFATKRGWYLNLPTAGERVVTDATFRDGRMIFTSMIPDVSSPCAFGGSGWLLEFDAITGNRLGTPTFDTDANNQLTSADYLNFTLSGAGNANNVSGWKLGGNPAGTTFVNSGSVGLRLIATSKAEVETVRAGLGAGRDGRAMWREVR